jgi:hypothetical protein
MAVSPGENRFFAKVIRAGQRAERSARQSILVDPSLHCTRNALPGCCPGGRLSTSSDEEQGGNGTLRYHRSGRDAEIRRCRLSCSVRRTLKRRSTPVRNELIICRKISLTLRTHLIEDASVGSLPGRFRIKWQLWR